MLWIMDIIQKLTLPGCLIVDCCAGIFPVAKGCVVLLQPRRFVECDLDSECVALSLSKLAIIFAH